MWKKVERNTQVKHIVIKCKVKMVKNNDTNAWRRLRQIQQYKHSENWTIIKEVIGI